MPPVRFGSAALLLSAALRRAGCTSLACDVFANALAPAGLPFDRLSELRTWHVGCLGELLPMAAKHGA